jgi:N-acetylglucosamine-6-phosphate deacetylase
VIAGTGGEPWRRADGTIAGSQLALDAALRNARRFAGIDLCDAVAACTLRPARLLGVERERGTLRPGARADLALLDADGRVRETWLAGTPAWHGENFRSDGNREHR